jgi:hypothetical protein
MENALYVKINLYLRAVRLKIVFQIRQIKCLSGDSLNETKKFGICIERKGEGESLGKCVRERREKTRKVREMVERERV